jgi:histidinol-phosphate aminotransferase
MRPSWQESRYNDKKINLSNNICYDKILLDKIDNLVESKKFNFRQYPDEYIVYKSVSKYHNVDTKNISIGYGLGELIIRILKLKQIKKISIISPTWAMVEVFSNIFNIEHTLTLDYSVNTLYLANPNGVTGKCLSKTEIIELLDKFELVIVDEAYGEFTNEEFSVIDIASERDNLIVLKSFSKSLGLAGLRFGYAIGNENIVNQLQTTRPSCIINNMLITICDDLFKLIPEHVDRMMETKHYIETIYDCIPSHGNYVLLKNEIPGLEDSFMVKKLPNGIIRMALTNLDIFKHATINK